MKDFVPVKICRADRGSLRICPTFIMDDSNIKTFVTKDIKECARVGSVRNSNNTDAGTGLKGPLTGEMFNGRSWPGV
jgi:hypothetical protein